MSQAQNVKILSTPNPDRVIEESFSGAPFQNNDSNGDIPTISEHQQKNHNIVSYQRLNENTGESKSPDMSQNLFFNQLESKLGIVNPSVVDIQN